MTLILDFAVRCSFMLLLKKKMKERKREKDLKLALALLSHDESELMYFSPPPPALEYESELRYMCLPENKSRGIQCKMSLKKGGHLVWAPKIWGLFGVNSQKGSSVCKNAISSQSLQISH